MAGLFSRVARRRGFDGVRGGGADPAARGGFDGVTGVDAVLGATAVNSAGFGWVEMPVKPCATMSRTGLSVGDGVHGGMGVNISILVPRRIRA